MDERDGLIGARTPPGLLHNQLAVPNQNVQSFVRSDFPQSLDLPLDAGGKKLAYLRLVGAGDDEFLTEIIVIEHNCWPRVANIVRDGKSGRSNDFTANVRVGPGNANLQGGAEKRTRGLAFCHDGPSFTVSQPDCWSREKSARIVGTGEMFGELSEKASSPAAAK